MADRTWIRQRGEVWEWEVSLPSLPQWIRKRRWRRTGTTRTYEQAVKKVQNAVDLHSSYFTKTDPPTRVTSAEERTHAVSEVREPIVWVIQETWSNRSDLSSAQRYGKIMPILSASDKPSTAPGPCQFKIAKAMRDYREGDYLCYTLADPVGIALVVGHMKDAGLTQAPVKWLRWERERTIEGERRNGMGFYVPTEIQL